MKRGFTMVELLAVFTLTGVILLLSLPKLTSMLKKSNDEEYQKFLSSIYIATEAYVTNNDIEVPTSVTIGDLISSGFLKSTLVNPKNNKTVADQSNIDKKVMITKNSDNVLNYSLQE